MAIAYDPKDAVLVLPEGEYNAVLEKYEEKVSKKGNDMMCLTWKIFPSDERPQSLVTDYVVLPAFTWKLKKLAASLGRLKDFEDKVFQPEDYVGASTRVMLKIDKQDGFDDKNAIGGYIAASKDDAPASKFAKDDKEFPKDPDIPFSWLIGFIVSSISLMGIC